MARQTTAAICASPPSAHLCFSSAVARHHLSAPSRKQRRRRSRCRLCPEMSTMSARKRSRCNEMSTRMCKEMTRDEHDERAVQHVSSGLRARLAGHMHLLHSLWASHGCSMPRRCSMPRHCSMHRRSALAWPGCSARCSQTSARRFCLRYKVKTATSSGSSSHCSIVLQHCAGVGASRCPEAVLH